MEKKCSTCKQVKDITRFSRVRDRLHNQCKDCRSKANRLRPKEHRHNQYMERRQSILDKHLVKTYGITREQYNEMLIKQDYLCAICGRHQSESPKGLHTDHCHDTNKVRGLLCSSCNLALGLMKHNTTILTKAVKYLGG